MTKAIEINAETNEIIERDLTPEELAEKAKSQLAYDTRIAEQQAKAASKAALLDRLGITEDEAKLLLS